MVPAPDSQDRGADGGDRVGARGQPGPADAGRDGQDHGRGYRQCGAAR